jgi:hypothetical protein
MGTNAILGLLSLIGMISVDAGFVRIGGHDGVEVYLRPDSRLIDLAAVGEIDAPPSQVQTALLDYDAHPHVNARLRESRVLSRHAGEELVYQHLKLPVIKDRDFTLRVHWVEGEARGIVFAIDRTAGPPATRDVVRMTLLDGSWELQPIRGNAATRAIYHLRLDLAGSVPRWLVRGGAAKDVLAVYQGLRRLINDRRCHQSASSPSAQF